MDQEELRNIMIVKQACLLASMGRQVLVLSSRKNHLKYLAMLIKKRKSYKYNK